MSNRPPYHRGKRPTRDHISYDSLNDSQRSKHDGKLTDRDSHPKFRTRNERSPARGHGRFGGKDGRPTSGRGRDRDDGAAKRRDPSERDRTIYSRGGGGSKNDGYSHSHSYRSNDRLSGEAISRQNGSSDVGYGGVAGREFVSSDYKRQSGHDPKNFNDDSRLSKLMRRICHEDDRDRRVGYIKQLREFLVQPENAKTVAKMAENLLFTLQDVLFERAHREVKQEVTLCIGAIGVAMGTDALRYFQWLSTKLNGVQADEMKILLLSALHETLNLDIGRKNLAEHLPLVMNNCQVILENADQPDLLVAIIDVVLQVSKIYPGVFASHFKDTVDILVGWHIDPTQKESLMQYTSDALVGFQPFWVNDVNFSVTLLGQFLEDMEAYAEDLGLGLSGQAGVDEDMPTPNECITKLTALLRVFTTVLKCLGEYISPDRGPPITWEYLTDMLERVVKCVDGAVKCLYNDKLLISANNCLKLLVVSLGNYTANSCETLLPFLVEQTQQCRLLTNLYIISLLNLIQKVIEAVNTQLPVVFISQILGTDSMFHKLRFAQDAQVLSSLMAMYHAMLALKNIPLLEEAYRHVLGDVEVAFNKLLASADSDHQCHLVKANPYKEVVYSTKQAQAVIVFDVCALAEIGNTKNNLIGMWALSPSIFELFTQHLLPGHNAVLEQYPAVHYALLQALCSHCTRHGHFISSSQLSSQNTALEGTLMANVNPSTGAHFTCEMVLLTEHFTWPGNPWDSRRLCLKWAHDVVEALHSSQHIYKTKEFTSMIDSLVTLGFSGTSATALQVGQCLQSWLCTANCHPTHLAKRCVELCSLRMSDTSLGTRQVFTDLLRLLPMDVTIRQSNQQPATKTQKKIDGHVTSLEALWLARKSHMTKFPLGTFHSHNFKTVMGYVLHNVQPSKLVVNQWLERLYYTCQKPSKDGDKSDDKNSLFDNNLSQLWFWATWEAAQFCVQAKLRTPLGKPQETFTSIEAALKKLKTEVRNLEAGDGSSSSPSHFDKESGGVSGSLTRVVLLLQFMEHLEKLLYNAYEGCAVAMVSPPKTVRTFFRTNRGTCHEWLMRVRICIISIAEYCCQPAVVVRQAYELLRDMKDTNNTQIPEFEHVVLHAARALSQLQCPEAIQGLYAWCKEGPGKKMPWLKATIDVASRKYESAITDYQSVLQTYLTPDTALVDTKEHSDRSSRNSSPAGSPRHSGDGTRKMSILGTSSGTDVAAGHEGADPVVARFIVKQISESYESLGVWYDVLDWQEKVQQYRTEHSDSPLWKAFNTSSDINYIRSLAHFEEFEFEGVCSQLELMPGCSIDAPREQPQAEVAWAPRELALVAHKQFLRAVTLCETSNLNSAVELASSWLDQAKQTSEAILQATALIWPPVPQREAMLQLYCADLCHAQLNNRKNKRAVLLPLSDDLHLDPWEHSISTAMQAVQLLEVQYSMQEAREMEDTFDFLGQISRLKLATARLARKQQNFRLAETLLVDEVFSSLSVQPENEALDHIDQITIALSKVYACNGTMDQIKLINIEREAAKLLRSKSQCRDAVETLAVSVVGHAQMNASTTAISAQSKSIFKTTSELNARSLLSLVQWLQQDHKQLASLASQVQLSGQGDEGSVAAAIRNFKVLMELEQNGIKQRKGVVLDEEGLDEPCLSDHPILSDSDRVVGRLLHLATMQAPSLSKAWFALGGWCYKWGRKAVDNAVHGSVELSSDEKSRILDLLPKGTSKEETDSVLGILSQIHAGITSEEDISDQDQSLYDEGTETTRKQLLSSCLTLQIASDNVVDQLIDIWRTVVRRVYHYYQLSAKAYFTYLGLGEQTVQKSSMDGNITATLRLLRLLVKHAWELRGVLEDGLAHTPTHPWKGIIPQLFSRLNHPEPYVRQSVSDLLCRVAQDAPHLIVYPAVVGCSGNKVVEKESSRDRLLNRYLSEQGEEEERGEMNVEEALEQDGDNKVSQEEEEAMAADEGTDDVLQDCFTTIVDTLANTNPKMISEVRLLISELRRITLLWDELWLGTLNQHHQDVTRRLTQLENEVKKVLNNSSLSKEEKTAIIKEKHNTVLKPTVYTMERLRDITNQTPETKHEQLFQTNYAKLIEDALVKLKEPADPSHPSTSWQMFKQLHHSLQQKAQKRSSLVLNMEDISGQLASLKNTVIAMPGITSQGQTVTVEAIHHTVQILPTKTKPKKLVFMGSNGKKYPYLFKGLEDLHLDERIMQFLALVNNMFAKSNADDKRQFYARHYSVTPLGARSGLIQWVDGATPLFSLYKRWQQREAVAQQHKQQQSSGSSMQSSNPPAIPRPSEVYYSKLTPYLKDKGINNQDSRKEWPVVIMKKVMEELITETPKDLLARELWCSSTSPSEWWQVTQTYARSTAVMSMIGYIIGLGDRHLDNVLVDLSTGEVVHIDYNVCFEKGKGLRVPEKVPFRMTQNIEAALGVTGVEGIFRLSCEHVIKTMRKGRETLLTLLEAFVYDPLVDWTTGNEGGYTGAFYGGGHSTATSADSKQSKKDMEKEITLSMFSIRIAEMKAAWFKNRDEMLASLPPLLECTQSHLQSHQDLQALDTQTEKLEEQKSYLEEALTDDQHMAYSLQQRYETYSIVRNSKTEALQAVQEKLDEYQQWHKAHQFALDATQGSKLQKMCADCASPQALTQSAFAPVVDFLQGAGQAQMVTQCEQVAVELGTMLQQRRHLSRNALDVLRTYATIVSHYPRQLLENNRCAKFDSWLIELVSDFSSDKCRELAGLFQEQFGLPTGGVFPQTPQVFAMEAKLKNIVAELNNKLLKLIERRNVEPADTALLDNYVVETTTAVHQFMRENGLAGVACMTSVVVSALCSLTKRYLVMEGAAAAAGERLMDLTSRDGDWFLDELCSVSGNVNQLLLAALNDPCVCQILKAETCHRVMQAMTATHTVYLALQDLNINFRSIILPESLKTLQCGDASVMSMLGDLDDIISNSGRSLDTLLTQLETQLRNIIMDMQTDDEVVRVVRTMRQQFDKLLQGSNPECTELTPGQMLLMGFNGLFTQLETDFSNLLEQVGRVVVPDVWRKVDIVREARSIQMTSFTDATQSLLSKLFFVKQLKAMQDFFHLALDHTATLTEGSSVSCLDDDQLAKPIKHFTAEYVRKHMIGLPSQTLGYILCMYIEALNVDVTAEIELRDIGAESKVCIEDLCKKVMDMSVKNNVFEPLHLKQASSLIATNDTTWRNSDLTKRLDNSIALLKVSLQRAQFQLTRYQWLHEEVLTAAGRHPGQMLMPARGTVMSELRKCMQSLMVPEINVAPIQERHLQLEASVSQRLKWGAGANPTLAAILQQFEEMLAAKNAVIQADLTLTSDLVALCNAVLHFEAMRTRTPEALSADNTFQALLSRCEESCQLIEACATSVTDTEEALMMSKPVDGTDAINAAWIQSSLEKVESEIESATSQTRALRAACDASKEGVKSQVNNIRSILTTHHKLMSDVRSILKSMAKQEEQDCGPEVLPGSISEYVNTYKTFSENFTTVLKLVLAEELTSDVLADIEGMMVTLKEQIALIYNDLVRFAPPLNALKAEKAGDSPAVSFATALKKSDSNFPPVSPKRAGGTVARPDLYTGTPSSINSPQTVSAKFGTPSVRKVDKVTRDPKTGKAIQERNSYAVGVWRRVKMKLDGRDPDINKRFSVPEQVDFVIKEATSLDNLAVLYEGWTPWV